MNADVLVFFLKRLLDGHRSFARAWTPALACDGAGIGGVVVGVATGSRLAGGEIQGVGLGLCIAARYARLMGGALRLERNQPRGTVARVVISAA